MRLTTAEAAYVFPSEATLLKHECAAKAVVAIFDGAGCWGRGRDAAAWSRAHLEARWAESCADLTLAQVESDIAQLHRLLPDAFRQDEFGAMFSAVAAILEDDRISIVAAGLFSAFVQRGENRIWLYKAKTLFDHLEHEGTTKVDAKLSKAMHVGSIIDAAEPPTLLSATFTLEAGDTFIAMKNVTAEALSVGDIRKAESAAEVQQRGVPHQTGPAAVIMLRG